MRKFSIENLLSRNNKFVEKKKIIFAIPCAIILVGIIFFGIFWGTLKSPLNLGMDFTGGYTVQIKAGSKMDEESFDDYKESVISFMQDYTFVLDETEYKVRFDENNGIKRLGSSVNTSMRIEFRAPAGLSKVDVDDLMDDLREDLAKRLNQIVGNETPVVSIDSDGVVKASYAMAVSSYVEDNTLRTQLTNAGFALNGEIIITDKDGKDEGVLNTVSFKTTNAATEQELKDALTINDLYSARAISTDMIGGSVSSDLIYKAITAVIIALFLMLVYIIIRFEFASGISSILALLHDIIIMFVFMIIFRLEFNATFIAGLITILGYSINNSIIVFDRIRENTKIMLAKDKSVDSAMIANRSIAETFGRSINTTITTLIMILSVVVVCAIGGITDMVTFGLPIIIGLGAGLFSSVLIAPTIWSMLKKNNLTPRKTIFKKNVKETVGSTAEEA